MSKFCKIVEVEGQQVLFEIIYEDDSQWLKTSTDCAIGRVSESKEFIVQKGHDYILDECTEEVARVFLEAVWGIRL